MPYAVIYGNSKDTFTQKRDVIGILSDVVYTLELRTFDLGSSVLTGHCTEVLENPAIYVLFENDGTYIHSAFIKKAEAQGEILTLRGEDFKKQLDNDVLLDFSNDLYPNLSLSSIYQKVFDEVYKENISNINLFFIVSEDLTDTEFIANFSGRYIIVNALKFLKPYLSYYEYFIKCTYSIAEDAIVFEIVKSPAQIINVNLTDFEYSQTSNDIKANRVVATIAFPTNTPGQESWEESDEAFFNSSINNRGTVSNELPEAIRGNFPKDYALRVIKNPFWEQISTEQFNQLSDYSMNSLDIFIREAVCPATGPTLAQFQSIYPATLFQPKTKVYSQHVNIISSIFELMCGRFSYFKYSYESIEYYKKVGGELTPRPNLPKKIYALGRDNNVYEGNPPDEFIIVPTLTQYFESETLSDAQFNAIYFLMTNRWVENIILKDTLAPIDVKSLTLFQKLKVYDRTGKSKILPVSEIMMTNEKTSICHVKLGFKKTSFTEIIKNEISEPESITKQANAGSVIIGSTNIPISTEQPTNLKDGEYWLEIIAQEEGK